MATAPRIRGYGENVMPTQAGGDVLVIFAGNSSSTPATLSSDWKTVTTQSQSGGYSVTLGYKISDGNSTQGTLTNCTYWQVISVAGSSGANTIGNYAGSVVNNGVLTIPALGAKDAALRLTFAYGIAGGGNPPFAGYSVSGGGFKVVNSSYYTLCFWGGGTNTANITDNYYGIGAASLITVQILPPPPSTFLAMF